MGSRLIQPGDRAARGGLTKRQVALLQAMADYDGSVREVADAIHLSDNTLVKQLQLIRARLGVKQTRTAVVQGLREGWLK